MSLTQEVKDYALSHGAHLVGVAPVERFEGAPRGHHPADLLPGAKSVVVVSIRLFQRNVDHPRISAHSEIIPEEALPRVQQHFYRRTNYETVNWALQLVSHQIAYLLSEAGYDVMPCPVTYYDGTLSSTVPGYFAPFSHRHAAVLAGLGTFGLSNLVLSPRFGPRNRFNSIITTAELEPDEMLPNDVCRGEDCRICLDSWPQCFGEMHELTMAGRTFRLARMLGCKAGCGGGGCIRVCPVQKEVQTQGA